MESTRYANNSAARDTRGRVNLRDLRNQDVAGQALHAVKGMYKVIIVNPYNDGGLRALRAG